MCYTGNIHNYTNLANIAKKIGISLTLDSQSISFDEILK